MYTTPKRTLVPRKPKFAPLEAKPTDIKRKHCTIDLDNEDDEIICEYTPPKKRVKSLEPIMISSQDFHNYEIVDSFASPSLSLVGDEDIEIGGMENTATDDVILRELHESDCEDINPHYVNQEYIPLSQYRCKTFNLYTQNDAYAQGELSLTEDSYQSPTMPPMTQATTLFSPHIQMQYPGSQATNIPLDVSINVRFVDASNASQCEIRLFGNETQVLGITTAHKNTLSYAPQRCLRPCQIYRVEIWSKWMGMLNSWEFKTKEAGPINVYVCDRSWKMKRITLQREGIVCLSELLAKASRKFEKEVSAAYFDEQRLCPIDDDDLITLEEGDTVYINL
jgi:hypothetical protein